MNSAMPPPQYSANKAYGSSATPSGSRQADPLLPEGPRDAWAEDEDDFKIGVSVSSSSLEIRHAFIRKVYTILTIQLLFTALIGAVSRTETISTFLLQNQWVVIASMVASFASLGLVFWKRHSHPTNLFALALFTACEAAGIGFATSTFAPRLVLQALLITGFIFAGLSLYTLQSKRDFSAMGSYLFYGIWAFLGVAIVQIFLPFSRTTDLFVAGGGILLFSAFIVYDTHMLMARLSPDEWVLASVSLYLDVINLFLQVLRFLNSSQDD